MILKSCAIYALDGFRAKQMINNFNEYKLYSIPTNRQINTPNRIRDITHVFINQNSKTGITVKPYWSYAWINKYFYLSNRNVLIDIEKLKIAKLDEILFKMTKLKAEEYVENTKLNWEELC